MSFLCCAAVAIVALAAAVPTTAAVAFDHVVIDTVFRSEGLAVADFNRDGHLDIAVGQVMYLGPDWKMVPLASEPQAVDPHGYSDYFLCFAEDIDGDGWLDLVNVGFPGAQTNWFRNPGTAGGLWERHLAVEKTGSESPHYLDIDGDGKRELVFISTEGMALAKPGPDPTQLWPIHTIAAPDDPRPGHGLGVGDVNGDGRLDILIPQGWWEQPADRTVAHWPFHPGTLSEDCAQMIVVKLPGCDKPAVVSTSAHRYGVWWAEQTADGWQLHEIDKSISQTHALCVADLNGDGVPDLITGKRFWAHTQGDPGIDEPSVMAWYESRIVDGRPAWTRQVIGLECGVGLHFEVRDVNGDGLLDIVTSNKKGVHVFLQNRKVADG